jgi:hypothetical protein
MPWPSHPTVLSESALVALRLRLTRPLTSRTRLGLAVALAAGTRLAEPLGCEARLLGLAEALRGKAWLLTGALAAVAVLPRLELVNDRQRAIPIFNTFSGPNPPGATVTRGFRGLEQKV